MERGRRLEHHATEGFTLIELLVVIIIIAILSAIAIPSYLNHREKAYRSQAINDMANAAIAIETFSTDHNGDYSGMNGADQSTPALRDQGFNGSQWVSVNVTADVTSYCVVAVNSKVPDKQFVLASSDGTLKILAFGSPTC